MELRFTSVFERNSKAWHNKLNGTRRAVNQGGTRSSKTYSILQLLILIAQHTKQDLIISVVSESLPHLKRGAIRDFFDLMGESSSNNPRYNMSDHVYDFSHDGLKILFEFFPADEPAKLRGGKRHILFINECNNVAFDAFRELDIRTEIFTFLDYNPVSEFWLHESGMLSNPENTYIHSTYLDALNVLPTEVVKNIVETAKNDPNWANVYAKGQLGSVEGLVYPAFTVVDALPDHGQVVYGLDFGFAGDEAALVKNLIIAPHDNKPGEVYSQEIIYSKNLTNQDLSARMETAGLKKHYDEIFADSAEPKSIEELNRLGWNVKPCQKGEGSVEFGHQKLRQYKQFWTKDSLNGIKEQRNFRYIQDKDGKLTEKTTHNWSHCMDARRYGAVSMIDREHIAVVGLSQKSRFR